MFFAVSLNIMWSDLGVNMKECPHLNTHLNGRKLPKLVILLRCSNLLIMS